MRIAFFISEFPSVSETFIANQLIALKKQNHLVHIYSKNRNKGIPVHETINNSGLLNDIIFLDERQRSPFKNKKALFVKCLQNPFNGNIIPLFRQIIKKTSPLSIFNFIPFLNTPKYDVVHAHFGVNGNYVTQLRKMGLFKKARFITTFHGYDLDEQHVETGFYADLIRQCHQFTVNSNYSKSRLLKLGVNENDIFLLPVGVNLELFKGKKNIQSNNPEIILLFIGRLIKLKGPGLFVRICHLLKEKYELKFQAKIIGDGILLNDLQKLIDDSNLNDSVTLCGSLTQEKIIEQMEEADIFVLPGIYDEGKGEAQGLVIQEAQAMNLPVLISDVGGMPEGIIDGVTGFVLSENDLEAFADKIVWLANNPEKRKEMGQAGRKFVEDKFDIEKLNQKLLGLYQGQNAKAV
jgi:colanic acid/amylovoran biosynthesis glycosyltransferase